MDQQPPSPEQEPLSEVDKLQYRLQLLFLTWDPKLPGPWNEQRYVDGLRENIFNISHSPDTGTYELAARITSGTPIMSSYEVVNDTLTSDGKFLDGSKAKGAEPTDPDYNELRARHFNNLLKRSTSKPYGRLGRMILRARFRFAI